MDDKPVFAAAGLNFACRYWQLVGRLWCAHADWQRGLWLIVAMSALALIVALIAQYGFGYPPCILCLWQRVPYGLCILIGLCGNLLPKLQVWRGALLLLCAGLFLGEAGLAYFHHGVEEHWWEGTAGCAIQATANDDNHDNASALRMALLAQPVARCDTVGWSMLGISITLWNVAYAMLGVVIAMLLALFARPRGRVDEAI
jgi:disulfide bond formation protein DsbB